MINKNTYLDNKKNSNVTFIHKLSHDGRGIATIQNITTFIDGSLPNETITYRVRRRSNHYHEAETLSILQVAPERVTPMCQHFGTCGGCSLQHMNDAMQLQLKENTLLEQLQHFGQVTPESVLPPLQASTSHYRRKARLGVKYVTKKEKVLVGFREKSSRYLADITVCPVLHNLVSNQLTPLSQLIASLSIYQHIPQIEIAMGDTEVALIFRHLTPLTLADQQALINYGQTKNFHIYLQANAPLPLAKLWPTDGHLRLQYTLPDQQLTLSFHPLDFTQINLEINRKMINQALNLLELKRDETVLDLFCGIGNFTLPLALHCAHVVGVEGASETVERARENASANNLFNIEFHVTNLQQPIKEAAWLNKPYDKILIDPPRTGAKEMLPYLKQLSPKKILYISCNPATLARDAYTLVHQHHYTLKQAGIMNMFPHTSHIEAMAVFDKNK